MSPLPFPPFHGGLQVEHGPKLVPLVLGLLAVRRGGLSASALLDAVSACDDVMGAKGQIGTVMQFTGAGRARVCPFGMELSRHLLSA